MPSGSPYSLRPSRFRKDKAPETESLIESEGERQWEDARCMICMEPPHNAILLHCASYSKGCRPYLCDTSARHSNCFKQFRRNNKSRFTSKTMQCPLCRGEVFNETMKLTAARRFMNAKPRSCASEGCEFSGTYSQLEVHSKAEHPRCVQPKVDPVKRRQWEQRVRDDEYAEVLNAIGENPRSPVEIDNEDHEVMNATGGNPHRVVERNVQLAEVMNAGGNPPRRFERHANISDLMRLPPRRPEVVHPWLMYNPQLQLWGFDGIMQDAFGGSGQVRFSSADYAAAFRARLVLQEQVARFYGWPSI